MKSFLYSHHPPNLTDFYIDQFMKYLVWQILFSSERKFPKIPKAQWPQMCSFVAKSWVTLDNQQNIQTTDSIQRERIPTS